MNRVLVYGGRDFTDAAGLSTALTMHWKRNGEFCVIEGGAIGADRMAREWAQLHGLPVITMNANWTVFQKTAGPVRNAWMLKYGQPTYAIGFPGGAGTRDMTRRIEATGIPLWQPFG